MSGRSLAGFLALDVLLLATGYALLLAFLGRFGPRRALLLGGVAFWLGTAAVGLLLTLLAVLTSALAVKGFTSQTANRALVQGPQPPGLAPRSLRIRLPQRRHQLRP